MSAGDRLVPIVASVETRLVERRRRKSEAALTREAEVALAVSPRRSLLRRLAGGRARPRPAIIAEIKRRSPAAGPLGQDVDALARARAYASGGAAALSVVTEPDHFGGDPADLGRVRPIGLPVLRKDFILSRYQLLESVVLGADAVLLIARILTTEQLAGLLADAAELNLECLVEINDETDAERALEAGATLIGINNRDLSTFQVDIARTERLLPLLPDEATVVSASGLNDVEAVMRMHRAGADACLIGEALMRRERPEQWLASLTGQATGEALHG